MSAKSEYMKHWRAANKERIKGYMRQYRTENAKAIAERQKEYRQDNAEKVKENWQSYWERNRTRLLTKRNAEYHANPGKWRAFSNKSHHKHKAERNRLSLDYVRSHVKELREYREKNRDKISLNGLLWRLLNPHKARAIVMRRRTRQKKAAGSNYTTGEHIRQRWEVWGNRCWICSNPADATDHVIPLSKGGSHWPANLRPICKSCNSRKSAQIIPTTPQEAKAFLYR